MVIFLEIVLPAHFTLIKAKVTAGKGKKIELPFLLVSDEKAKQITFLGQINRILIDFFN